jgi:hypothetical protein
MATSPSDLDTFPPKAADRQRTSTTVPFVMVDSSSKSDLQWMEIVGGGSAPFRLSFRILFRELLVHLSLPFSYIFIKCFHPDSGTFLWNHQLIFFGFNDAKARQSGRISEHKTRLGRASLFVVELCRMMWVLGLPTAMLLGVAVVVYVQQLDERDIKHDWISYSYYPEVTLIFVMSLIKTFFVSLKWALFPSSFIDLLRRERAPHEVLRNQQVLAQLSPTLVQTLWSKFTHCPVFVTVLIVMQPAPGIGEALLKMPTHLNFQGDLAAR